MGRKDKDLSVDQKKSIVSMHCEGHRSKTISQVFEISESAVSKILKQFRQTGPVENRRAHSGCGGKSQISNGRRARMLQQIVAEDPRKTLREIIAEFHTVIGADCSYRTVQRKLLSLRFKRRSVRKKI